MGRCWVGVGWGFFAERDGICQCFSDMQSPNKGGDSNLFESSQQSAPRTALLCGLLLAALSDQLMLARLKSQ